MSVAGGCILRQNFRHFRAQSADVGITDDDVQSDVSRAVRRGGPHDGHGRESSYFQFSTDALFGEPRNDKF